MIRACNTDPEGHKFVIMQMQVIFKDKSLGNNILFLVNKLFGSRYMLHADNLINELHLSAWTFIWLMERISLLESMNLYIIIK